MEKKFIRSIFSIPVKNCFSKLTGKIFYKRNLLFKGDTETVSLHSMIYIMFKFIYPEISPLTGSGKIALIPKSNCTDNKKYVTVFNCKIDKILCHIKVLFTTFIVKATGIYGLLVYCRKFITTSYSLFTKCRKQFSGIFYSLNTSRKLLKTCQELFNICLVFLTGNPGQLTGSHILLTENCMLNLICPDQNIKCHIQYTEIRIVFRIFPVPCRINPEGHGDFKKGLFF